VPKKIAKSKASKKSKNSNSSVSFRDPVTGVLVQSDITYGPESAVAKGFGGEFDTTVEYELSKSRFIITHLGVPKAGTPSYNDESINRFVFEGEFNYSSTGGFSGRLDRWSQGTFTPGDYPGGPFEYIDTLSVDSPRRFGSSAEFRSVVNDSTPGGSIPIRNIFAYEANAGAITRTNEYLGSIIFSPDKSGLSSLGLDGFYGGEWWTNPFAGNLV
jgi:hypothetical protein